MKRIDLIVPDETAVQRRAADYLEAAILSIAGGYSRYDGIGAWTDAHGETIRETHRRYEILTDGDDSRAAVVLAFQTYGTSAGEDSILYRIDGETGGTFLSAVRDGNGNVCFYR